MVEEQNNPEKRKRRRAKRPRKAGGEGNAARGGGGDMAQGEAREPRPGKTVDDGQPDLFETLESREKSKPNASPSSPPQPHVPGSRKASDTERPRRRSFLRRRRRDEEDAARHFAGAEATPTAADASGAPSDETSAPAESAEESGTSPSAVGDVKEGRLPPKKAPRVSESDESVVVEPVMAEPDPPYASDVEHDEDLEAESSPSRLLLSAFLGIVRLVLTTAVVIGVIGIVSFYVVKSYVGGQEVAVPILLGDTLDEALEKLKPDRLYLQLDRREYSDEVARGRILGQFPAPHTTVKARSPIKVVLSDGPYRRRAPELVGLTDIIAGVELRKVPGMDLDVGERSFVHWPGTKKGDVIGQDPPAGTPVRRGSRIHLLVSMGPPPVFFEMPDLEQKTIQEARIALGEMHLTITDIREVDQPGFRRGVVVTQSPRPGQRVSRSTPIILTLATGL